MSVEINEGFVDIEVRGGDDHRAAELLRDVAAVHAGGGAPIADLGLSFFGVDTRWPEPREGLPYTGRHHRPGDPRWNDNHNDRPGDSHVREHTDAAVRSDHQGQHAQNANHQRTNERGHQARSDQPGDSHARPHTDPNRGPAGRTDRPGQHTDNANHQQSNERGHQANGHTGNRVGGPNIRAHSDPNRGPAGQSDRPGQHTDNANRRASQIPDTGPNKVRPGMEGSNARTAQEIHA